ncbi:hypothetical protein RR48_05957 [Papilio machaon]|uniref:Uncharacterized protein n=1 Tax=Papilio machaon TaxID=76193 RepID=A0A0N1IAL9_PAPMA|nr:hypothetical protein RR48_05957 [Papilio machaon]
MVMYVQGITIILKCFSMHKQDPFYLVFVMHVRKRRNMIMFQKGTIRIVGLPIFVEAKKRPRPRATLLTMHDRLSGYITRLSENDAVLLTNNSKSTTLNFSRSGVQTRPVRQPCAAHSSFYTNPGQLHASRVPTIVEVGPVSLGVAQRSYNSYKTVIEVTNELQSWIVHLIVMGQCINDSSGVARVR